MPVPGMWDMSADAGARDVLSFLTKKRKNKKEEKKKIRLEPRDCLQFVIVVFPDHTHLLSIIIVC